MLVDYLPKDWAQLSFAQESSIQKRHAEVYSVPFFGCGGVRGGCGDNDHVHLCGPQHGQGDRPKRAVYKALAASVANLFKNVNVMSAQMAWKTSNNEDAKPAADRKMGTNTKPWAL